MMVLCTNREGNRPSVVVASPLSVVVVCMMIVVGMDSAVGVLGQVVPDRHPMTDSNLPKHVAEWRRDSFEARQKYGHISTWDTSRVTRMFNLFAYYDTFNEDISYWDVSAVKDFKNMFWDAYEFDQDLSRWNTSSAKTMACMFCGAIRFNADLSGWDVSGVDDMYSMFDGAGSFNQDLSNWDVRNADNMREMFHDATSMNRKVCFASGVNETGLFLRMFEGSSACFDKTCVSEEILVASECSAASSIRRMQEGWLGNLLLGLGGASMFVLSWLAV